MLKKIIMLLFVVVGSIGSVACFTDRRAEGELGVSPSHPGSHNLATRQFKAAPADLLTLFQRLRADLPGRQG